MKIEEGKIYWSGIYKQFCVAMRSEQVKHWVYSHLSGNTLVFVFFGKDGCTMSYSLGGDASFVSDEQIDMYLMLYPQHDPRKGEPDYGKI